MAKDNIYNLEDILAEFGNESRAKDRTEPGDHDLGVPQDGPDLIPLPERPHQEPEEEKPRPADWKDNTIQFPGRPPELPEEPEEEEEEEPPPGTLPAQGQADPIDALIEDTVDSARAENSNLLEFPPPEPTGPIGSLLHKADEFASHMYEEDVEGEKLKKVRRAEKLIPGVDREEKPPTPPKEKKVRPKAPPPPDIPPQELSKSYAKGLNSLRIRTTLLFLLSVLSLVPTLAGNLLPTELTPALQRYILAGIQAAALLLSWDLVLRAFSSAFRGWLGPELLVVFSGLFCLAHALTSDLPPFSALSVLALWTHQLGALRKQRGQRLACKTAGSASTPYLVTRDEGQWNGKDTYAKWSGPVYGFGSQIQTPDGAQRIYRVFTPVLLTACLVLSLVASVGRGRSGDLLWCLSALFTAAAPLASALVFGTPWFRLSARLAKSGGALAGWPGVMNTTGSANLILTDSDLFPPGSVTVNGVKFFGTFPIDIVTSSAASVIRDAGSGLEKLFHDLMRSQGTVYRRGKDLQAHEGGGYIETIRDSQVLVGSAAFMVLMGVPLPQGLKVKNAVFCAIDGELAGIFALGYNLPGTAPEAIDSLIHNGVTPLLCTRDFNLIPNMLRQRFKLPVDRMEYPPVDRRRELSDPDRPHSDTLTVVLCREGLAPYAEAVVGARRLRSAVRLSALLCCLGAALGVGLAFYLTSVAAYASMTPLNLLIFLLLWTVPPILISGWVNRY